MTNPTTASYFTPRHLLVTGGAGFIGSAYVRHVLEHEPEAHITVLDKLTYAGNRSNLTEVLEQAQARVRFVQGDIADATLVGDLCADVDTIVNFAAETHVDRSLTEPGAFIQTDVYGVYVLLEAARSAGVKRVLQVSTDEVYGHVPAGYSRETDALAPRSPYAASKAGGELMCGAYAATWGLPVLITRGSNTFGPRQYPEKMIPLFITNLLQDLPVPVYGDGLQVRDWLAVEDHCAGIHHVLRHGQPGTAYNVGGGNERQNIAVVRLLLQLLGKPDSLIRYVTDRPGHDRRYALDCGALHALGWQPIQQFETALGATVDWYVEHREWWQAIRRGDFAQYYQQTYAQRPGFGSGAPTTAKPTA